MSSLKNVWINTNLVNKMSQFESICVDEFSCDDGRSSCCSEIINLEKWDERIKNLETNDENNASTIALINKKLDAQTEIMKQILYLQQNNNSSQETDYDLEDQQILIHHLSKRINSLEENNVENEQLHINEVEKLKNEMEDLKKKMNKNEELHEKQINEFEQIIYKNNLENLKEISSLREKLLTKINEENNINLINKQLLQQQLEEKIKKINFENAKEFEDIRNYIQIQLEKITNIVKNEEIIPIKTFVEEIYDKLILLERKIEDLKNQKEIFVNDENECLINHNHTNINCILNEEEPIIRYIKFDNNWGYINYTQRSDKKFLINNNVFIIEFMENLNFQRIQDILIIILQDIMLIGVDSLPNIVIAFGYELKQNKQKCCFISYSNYGAIKFPGKYFKDEDICGCGIVFPPNDLPNKKPYIFFTYNGILFVK
ncbi:hypothetical protein Mgra_00002215 [Meloidogyne graminicola]|uniref:Uncharacterized protein n=1 Tax=Meloidogyne graminicola TaxID=189291 RepID=A0A8S9ZY58_9BILA|nr:hypothetical protein Mgra_00002215 [Meloidogyne graminicola]